MTIVQTDRLLLRTFVPEDLDELAPIMADPEVMRFSTQGPWERDQTLAFINGCMENYSEDRWGFGLWAVIHMATDRLIGYCGLSRFDDIDGAPEIEIGYRLTRRYWNKGLATEASLAVRDYALEQLHLTRLVSIVDPANIASIHVAEKVGMKRTKQIVKWGKPLLLYVIERTVA
jgi:ribosomal-protein-alanine N-acetyltransferase